MACTPELLGDSHPGIRRHVVGRNRLRRRAHRTGTHGRHIHRVRHGGLLFRRRGRRASCRGDWCAWGRPVEYKLAQGRSQDGRKLRATDFEVAASKQAVVQHEGLLYQARFGELNIRVPAYAH
jgi:hypothetical protein